MRYMLTIDFGSAYTKVGIRRKLDQPSELITEESLVLDPLRFCIPTLAAVAERGGKTRWGFGPNVAQVRGGNGIRIFRNWKAQLFMPARPPGNVASGTRSRRGAVRSTPAGPSNGGFGPDPADQTDLDVKDVTLRYFTWLRQFLVGPCERLGIHDLGIIPVRLCVPAFGDNGRAMNDYSPAEQLLLEILSEAGWNPDDEQPIVSEPESNAIGIYTKGNNATWTPKGPRGPRCLHFQEMFVFGGYLAALRRRALMKDARRHHVLVIDVGAFTTDLALLEFDLDDERKPPEVICESEPVGVQQLDQGVLRALPAVKTAQIKALDARAHEELKRSIYVDQAPYHLPGKTTIGSGAEAETIADCVTAFAEMLAGFISRVIGDSGVERLEEVILTGGGNFIPGVCSTLTNAILNQELGTRLVHSPLPPPTSPSPSCFRNRLDPALVRGSSAVGGCSVYFEKRFW